MKITTAYISHGGGPLPILESNRPEGESGENHHKEMIEILQQLSKDIPKPDAIVVVSAHWEEASVNVTTGEQPKLIYDYYGFPASAYRLQYPALGIPNLAASIVSGLQNKGISAVTNSRRGFDHGMFIPLTIMYPNADIPCVQVSLCADLEASKHLDLGKSLRQILEERQNYEHVLILGSGTSFHNMRAFFDDSEQAHINAHRFNNWLQDTMASSAIAESARWQQLIEWNRAPGAIFSHPRPEHLIPLHVCYGANERNVDNAISLTLLTKPASMFVWNA